MFCLDQLEFCFTDSDCVTETKFKCKNNFEKITMSLGQKLTRSCNNISAWNDCSDLAGNSYLIYSWTLSSNVTSSSKPQLRASWGNYKFLLYAFHIAYISTLNSSCVTADNFVISCTKIEGSRRLNSWHPHFASISPLLVATLCWKHEEQWNISWTFLMLSDS